MKNIAIVTGASVGLGAEFAKQINQKYSLDEIWLVARRQDELNKVAEQLQHSKGIVLCLDLSNQEDIDTLNDKINAEQPQIKLLVNNAGFATYGHFTDTDLHRQLDLVKVNIEALVELTYVCLMYMAADSQIINIASSAGFNPSHVFNLYAASKAFVLHFTLGLQAELRGRKIAILAVCPGPVATEFFQTAKWPRKAAWMDRFILASPQAVVAKALRDIGNRSISIYGWQFQIFLFLTKFLPKSWMANIN